MTQETVTIVISIISFIIAIISMFFSWRAVLREDRTYVFQVITQIYNSYNSPTMRQDLQTVWKLYHQAWKSVHKDNSEKAKEKANSGIPISEDVARDCFQNIEYGSPEYKALDNVVLFWDYIAVLISTKVLSIEHLSAFLTPRVLGFLYPIERAKANYYGYRVEPMSSLHRLYESWKRKSPDTF